MEVILIQDVAKVGKKNSIYKGTDGFCRNFLFRKNYAIPVTRVNLSILAANKKALEISRSKMQKKVKLLTEQLIQQNITFLLDINPLSNKTHKAITHLVIKKQILQTIQEVSSEDFESIDFKFAEKIYTKKQKSFVTLSFGFGVCAKIPIDIR